MATFKERYTSFVLFTFICFYLLNIIKIATSKNATLGLYYLLIFIFYYD